jgi:hypothetical protein
MEENGRVALTGSSLPLFIGKKTLKSYLDKIDKSAPSARTEYCLHPAAIGAAAASLFLLHSSITFSAGRERGKIGATYGFAPPYRDQRVRRRTFCDSARAWRRCCFCDAAGRHTRTYVFALQTLVQESRFRKPNLRLRPS